MADTDLPDLTTLTVELLSAYVANNSVRSDDLAGLIQSTHAALSTINTPAAEEMPAAAAPEHIPAVSVRKSLSSRDHIISMIDGKPYKTLKRHLAGHGLTPESYRERYALPPSYPMVAPSYSERRREVAQRLGLGRKPRVPAEGAEETPAAPARRGRKPKAAVPA